MKVLNIKKYQLLLFLLGFTFNTYSSVTINSNNNKVVPENKIIDFRYENGTTSILNLDNKTLEHLDSGTDSDKYYLIRSGIKFPSWKPNRIMRYYQQEGITEETCKLENASNLPFVVGNNFKTAKENFNTFLSCIKFKVEDPKKAPLEIDEKVCNFKKIDDSSAIISQGDCFIKAKKDQFLTFEIIPNKDCNDRQFLITNSFFPKELTGTIEAWIYPKNNIGPVFVPTRQLWEKSLNINLNPGNELLKTADVETEDGNIFKRVSQFTFPDLIVSSINVSNLGANGSLLDISFLLSTFKGSSTCSSSLCSNYLNFDVPFAPEAILYEIKNPSKKYEIGAFKRIGDRLPGQWNGEFKAQTPILGIVFEKGVKYTIDFIFSDPYDDYTALKKSYKSIIGGISTSGFDSLNPGVDVLGSIRGINGNNNSGSGTLDRIPSFGNSTAGITRGINIEIGDIIPRIEQTLNDITFPPQYSTVCSKESKICNRSNNKEHLRISIAFEVVDVQGNNVKLGDLITVETISELYPKTKTNLDLKNKPTIKCSKN